MPVFTYRSRTLLACLRSFSRTALLLGSSISSSSALLEQLLIKQLVRHGEKMSRTWLVSSVQFSKTSKRFSKTSPGQINTEKKNKNGTHYLLDRFDFGGGPLVEFGIIELSTELDGFVSLSGGSLRFSAQNDRISKLVDDGRRTIIVEFKFPATL